MRTSFSNRRPAAFTLVEMLTVVGIISLLIALVAPTLVDVVRSTRLNSAGEGLVNRLSLAQQSAVSLSAEVEVRFYRYVDSTSDRPSDSLYYAYQVVQTMPDGTEKAISDPYYLESGIVISAQEDLSPLLKTTVQQSESSNGNFLFTPPGTATGDDVSYASLRFYPDGGMRLLSSSVNAGDEAAEVAQAYTIPEFNKSFLILVESKESMNAQVPPNYYCIQIDSYTGRTRVYRP
ncbi:Verru_Chthon cassette protein D [Prosthecobacter sp. SYSU 5D2]|uniref:Verru_Chthon cassette protein D n=1 Tax=Prosthecobacter sp. SYSU 5D2 TaxID=3134134 RepID=UPI0031FF1C65